MKTWDQMNSREKYARYAELAAKRLAGKESGNLAERKEEGERRHLQNEAYWLAKEQERYNMARRGKPLSRMAA